MVAYSKLIGTFIGSLVGFAMAYLVTGGLATCTVPADASTCTFLGLSSEQYTGAITMLVAMLGTFLAPKNKPA